MSYLLPIEDSCTGFVSVLKQKVIFVVELVKRKEVS
jgi:hypothetical protein